MYDAREKAIRDQQWAIDASFREGEAKGEARGKIEGKIEQIQALQEILCLPISSAQQLRETNLSDLETLAASLQEKIRTRLS